MPRKPNKNLREDLLKKAIHFLDTRGNLRFSMRELASELNYSVTAVYRVFRSRSHLLQVMQLRLFSELPAALMDTNPGTVRQKIRNMGGGFIRWAVTHPARYHFMFHSTEPEALLNENEQKTARAGLFFLEALIREGIRKKEFEVEDPAATATMLFASLHGLISLHLAKRLDPSVAADPVAFFERNSAIWADLLLREPGK